jgi:hypothetical protein
MSIRKMLDLSGKIALVAGGSRGLGLQMAKALGEMGADIAISARKRDELTNAVEHLKKLGRSTYSSIMPDAAWEAPAEDYPLDGWDKLVNLNLPGGPSWP